MTALTLTLGRRRTETEIDLIYAEAFQLPLFRTQEEWDNDWVITCDFTCPNGNVKGGVFHLDLITLPDGRDLLRCSARTTREILASIAASSSGSSNGYSGCNPKETTIMATKTALEMEPFKMAIGSPTNQERTYLCGEGVFCGEGRLLLAHALPIYRQKDYPNYQTRKQGPYVLSLHKCGIRVSATQQKMVFAKLEDAVRFAEALTAFFALFGIPTDNEDPRTVLEAAKEKKDQVYEPMKVMAELHGATFIEPQK